MPPASRTTERPIKRPHLEALLGSRLPFFRHVSDHVVANHDGMLMATIALDGTGFETADVETLNQRQNGREQMLRALAHPRFALYHHIIRCPVSANLPEMGPDAPAFAQRLHQQWGGALSDKQLYSNDLFITIIRRPNKGALGLFDRLLGGLKSPDKAAKQAELARDLRALGAACDNLLANLGQYGARLLGRYETGTSINSELMEFYGYLLSGQLRPMIEPQGPISHALADRRFSFGHDTIELHKSALAPRQFAAMVSIKDYPLHTSPGLLDELLRLPHHLVVSESFGFVDRQVALDRMNLALRRMRAADDDALSLRHDLSIAKDDVAAGRTAFGEHHLSIMVKASGRSELDKAVSDVAACLTEQGMIAVREDMNMENAFFAQFPGNFKDIARRALISSANFAALASLHNHAKGSAQNNHWGQAITILETSGGSPFAFNFHQGDLGNFTIIGPSGSGKTVVLNFLLAEAMGKNPRLVLFDKDRGSEIFIRAMGGRYERLIAGTPSGMNPLQLPDNPANRAFLQQWLKLLLAPNDGPMSAGESALIDDAIAANFEAEPAYRRLRYLAELLSGQNRPEPGDLYARLAPFIDEGPHAWLFDNAQDGLNLSQSIVGVDLTAILDDPILRTPTMMVLFHAVEQRLDGQPAMIVVDEGWKALDDDVFVEKIRDWEKTIRKRNGIVGFATQSASDALDSKIAAAIIEQAATQIFMPNSRAQTKDYCEGFGLSAHELALVRALPEQSRCFLVKTGGQSQILRLDLAAMPAYLNVLSGRESSVRQLDKLRAQYGDAPTDWLPKIMGDAQ